MERGESNECSDNIAEQNERIQSVSTISASVKSAATHVPERRPPERDHETRRIENHLHREPDFGDDLLVREGRHVLVGPGVKAVVCARRLDLQELVGAGRGNQFLLDNLGGLQSRTYNCTIRLPITGRASALPSRLMRSAELTVMRRRDLVLGNELCQVGRRRCRPIIERKLRVQCQPDSLSPSRNTHSQHSIRRVIKVRRLVAPVGEAADQGALWVDTSRVDKVARGVGGGQGDTSRVGGRLLECVQAREPGSRDGGYVGNLVCGRVEGLPC